MRRKQIIALLTIGLLTVGIVESIRQRLTKRDLSRDISITLDNALWKENKENHYYQDITLDLICTNSQCEAQTWGFAPTFNRAEHDGIVDLIEKSVHADVMQCLNFHVVT